ncbi:serine/threonine-protein kinase Nek3-like [Aotus nancymaae]|uniref:serine/threonine-protein kinase Nek3-like n=1 Tax=Aotus nancymaae TaxID=37293 RepID=UPI0030FEC030
MEYCDGGDLMQKIKQQKGKLFPEDMILNWFTQMCLGVNHIHRKCALHRDSKSKQEEEQDRKCSHPDLESINENLVETALRIVNREEKGGSVIKYSKNTTRKQWLKETPGTLLNIFKNADLSLAFRTYIIYRPGSEGFSKGPLSEETEASDSVDGGRDSVILDPERLEPGRDEEDTDFEEEDDNPDWVSELKKRAGWQGQCDPESH